MSQSEPFCLCSTGLLASQCCQRFHSGEFAPTAEALMRSRYVAYAEQRLGYLRDTWHPDTRPAQLDHDANTHWRRLQILQSSPDGDLGSSLGLGDSLDSDKDRVHFRATFYLDTQAGKQWGVLEEVSLFVREAGCWLYHSGDVSHHTFKPGRNDPCPCGSGKKLKKCCTD